MHKKLIYTNLGPWHAANGAFIKTPEEEDPEPCPKRGDPDWDLWFEVSDDRISE